MAFGRITVAFGTTNVGLFPQVAKIGNVIMGTSENPVRQIEFKNSFRNV